MGPQAFGLSMVNFDEHVVDAHAAGLGLLGGAAAALALLIAGVVMHLRPRSPRHWKASTCLLLGVIGVESLSIAGFTEHLGLFLFS